MAWLGIGVGVTDIPVLQHGSGGTPTPTPTPPILALANAPDAYPPQLNTTYDNTATVGMVATLQIATDEAFTSPTTATHTITGTDVTNGGFSWGSALTSISSGTHYFRETIGGSAYSNTVGHGSTTAATITSGNTFAAIQGYNSTEALTANQTVTWALDGGADAISASLVGSTLTFNSATTGTKYVQVKATNLFGIERSQLITVTVAANQPDILAWTTQTNAAYSTAYRPNLQQVSGLAPGSSATLTPGGSSLWVKGSSATPPAIGSYSSTPFSITNGDWIGPAATSGASDGITNTAIADCNGRGFSFAVSTPALPAAWNPADKNAGITLPGGFSNLKAVGTASGGPQMVRVTVSRPDAATSAASIAINTIANGGGSNFLFGLCRASDALNAAPTDASYIVAGTWGWETHQAAATIDHDYTGNGSWNSAGFALVGGQVQFYYQGSPAGAPFTPPAGTGDLFAFALVYDASAFTANFGSY